MATVGVKGLIIPGILSPLKVIQAWCTPHSVAMKVTLATLGPIAVTVWGIARPDGALISTSKHPLPASHVSTAHKQSLATAEQSNPRMRFVKIAGFWQHQSPEGSEVRKGVYPLTFWVEKWHFYLFWKIIEITSVVEVPWSIKMWQDIVTVMYDDVGLYLSSKKNSLTTSNFKLAISQVSSWSINLAQWAH